MRVVLWCGARARSFKKSISGSSWREEVVLPSRARLENILNESIALFCEGVGAKESAPTTTRRGSFRPKGCPGNTAHLSTLVHVRTPVCCKGLLSLPFLAKRKP
jgi:hypothetical protein